MKNIEARIIKFLENLGAQVSQIETESLQGKQTPDLDVRIGGVEIIAEIKSINENPSELKAIKAVQSREVISLDKSRDIRRYAGHVGDANRQLKNKCNGRPGLVLIADIRSFFTKSIAPQQILCQAMFGRETIWTTVPDFVTQKQPRTTSHDFGLGRTVGPESNTTVSAVGLYLEQQSGEHMLLLHHNPHAATPLPIGCFASNSVKEFVIPSTRLYCSFEEVSKNRT